MEVMLYIWSLRDRVVKSIVISIFAFHSNILLACNIDYNIDLNTFGKKVLVELRLGTPGNSSVVVAKRSNGGLVSFTKLCSGGYFLAIGDDESVNVTPVRQFEDFYSYQSSIEMTMGAGNLSSRSRSSL
jgi:hypothetical protein|tara:strand:- start:294 stop:680 length:387 start_codon:yes stop_codon:yes gene_type:complete